MNMTFAEEIRDRVAMELEGKTVVLREVEKENGVKRNGLEIRSEGSNIAPMIYFSEDRTVDENVDMIIRAYKGSGTPSFDGSWFLDYENVKTKLSVMLTSKPRKGLSKRKAKGFDDLYMHAYVIVDDVGFGRGTIKITDEHVKKWGITNAKLFADAIKSAKVITPSKRMSMMDALAGFGAPISDLEPPMTIVTNDQKTLGAAAILYTDVKENTYMLPSSLHEVILINGNSFSGMEGELNEMVSSVNSEVLAPEDFLSNHAYRYNGKKWENVV
ncbi:DUF5688 family protein [Butyrivibrio sp. INlla21]|uniref:DUF5688 family protein n=1 Tax=Butyrivibrio sp. INlla21 TaxID=1520811 RepID=UPI0008E3C0B1|nr:DUF5688 family protein [Butyrivibrio sp. INlla21]SFU36799.1 hypothetical protein SAMN02910342_00275 [Butyrivibrio sp. INlla21]